MTIEPLDDTNPLLDFSGLPRFADIRPAHVEPALDRLLAHLRAQREALFAGDAAITWDTFAQPLEDMDEMLHRMWSPVGHLNSVMNNGELRTAYNNCLPKLSDYASELAQDPRVYEGYKELAAGDEYPTLDRAQRKIIDNALRDFRLAGAELNDADKATFKANQQRLSELASKFNENVLDATNAWDLVIEDEAQLAGLPEFAIAMAKQSAEQEGKPGWRFTLDGPSFMAFMTYTDDGALRKQMYEAYVTRASDQGPNANQWDNGPIIVELLKLKQAQARLLGYDNYAEVSLASKMAGSVAEVMGFLNDLGRRSLPTARNEFGALAGFAAHHYGAERIHAWDAGYYSEKLRQAEYDFSQEELRPYFPVHQVLSGMFEVIHRIYGLRVIECEGVETWHDTVRVFDIHNSDGTLRGRFYLDLYARPHKRGGAWMDDCVSRKRTGDEVQTPVAYLVCNFSAPVGDRPALFTHNEVTTLFHEFGHGLHHMLTQVDHIGVSGINGVAWDAVELPSQFMENWCWQRESLDLLGRHYQTGEPIPDGLFNKMLAARGFQAGMHMVRQLEFSIFDMRLHSEFDPNGEQTVQDLLDEVRAQIAVIQAPAFNRFQNGFGHIFGGGYSAGYYSYKWAEVLSADAFAKFEERGIFDRATGEEFLHHILERGGEEEPAVLFRDFRGREPSIDALLRYSGLAG